MLSPRRPTPGGVMSTRNPTAMSNSDRLRALVFDEEVEYVEIVLDVLSFVRGEPHAWATTSVVEARRRASQEFFDLILAARVRATRSSCAICASGNRMRCSS